HALAILLPELGREDGARWTHDDHARVAHGYGSPVRQVNSQATERAVRKSMHQLFDPHAPIIAIQRFPVSASWKPSVMRDTPLSCDDAVSFCNPAATAAANRSSTTVGISPTMVITGPSPAAGSISSHGPVKNAT